MKLKQRRKNWLKTVLARTPDERKEREYRNLMRRMSQVNPRTYTGTTFINRNDPCYCGNTYSGTQLRGPGGVFVRDEDGEIAEIPVKFKHCCMSKHVGLKPGEKTPALIEKQKKEQAYFEKHRRIPT